MEYSDQNEDFGVLIRGITNNTNYYIGKKIEKYGIKQGQFEYFLLISNNPGINQDELARLKNVGKASVTKALKILENDGFVNRAPHRDDRRNITCTVSEKGKKIIKDLMLVKNETQKDLFRGFSEKDKTNLKTYLSQMHKNSASLIAELMTEDSSGGEEN